MSTTDTHDTRLAILWDVDGPLNPWAAKPTRRPEGYETHRLFPAGYQNHRRTGLRVWLNPAHGPKMVALARDLGAENWWATTWCSDANLMIAPLIGLPELPVVFVGTQPGVDSWKWPDVLDELSGRPLIWFDDEFDEPCNRAGREQFLRDRGDLPTLLHQVDPRFGLRDEDFDAARAWAVSLGESGV